MSSSIEQSQLSAAIAKINSSFEVHLRADDFKSSSYSLSSFRDIVVQKIQDEKSGDWTTDVAFHRVCKAIATVNKVSESAITMDTDLNEIFSSDSRKSKLKEMEAAMGIPLEILKPNSAVYGFFIFLFFVGIPLFSVGWFPALLTMVISALVIYILLKTANQFKMKTVGLLADHLAWKNYLKDKKAGEEMDRDQLKTKVDQLLA